jgi:hypothetical protein
MAALARMTKKILSYAKVGYVVLQRGCLLHTGGGILLLPLLTGGCQERFVKQHVFKMKDFKLKTLIDR